MLAKSLATPGLAGVFGTHESGKPSATTTSSAWREIEHKLHGLFGSEVETRKRERQGKRQMSILAVVAALVVFSYLLGRRQGRGRSTVLEVHKA